jgi:hypothetical protein
MSLIDKHDKVGSRHDTGSPFQRRLANLYLPASQLCSKARLETKCPYVKVRTHVLWQQCPPSSRDLRPLLQPGVLCTM